MTRAQRGNTGGSGRGRPVSVRAVRRDPPDLSKLGRAVIAYAMAEAEARAQADDADTDPGGRIESHAPRDLDQRRRQVQQRQIEGDPDAA